MTIKLPKDYEQGIYGSVDLAKDTSLVITLADPGASDDELGEMYFCDLLALMRFCYESGLKKEEWVVERAVG